MQQPHLERPFIFGTETDAGFLKELPDVRLEPHAVGRFPAAGGTGLDEHAVADLAGTCESLGILKAVIAAEAADGLAFLLDKRQRRMLPIASRSFFSSRSIAFLAKRRLERRVGRERCRCLPKTARSGPSPSTGWCRP